MSEIVRAIKFEVYFPGWRQKDLGGKKRKADVSAAAQAEQAAEDLPDSLEGKNGLYYRLKVARSEMTEAANRLLSNLYALRVGSLPRPVMGGKGVSDQTLSYQGFSGKWQPTGKPMYAPKGRKLAGSVLVGTSGLVHKRLTKDFGAVMRGEKSLATFRQLPFTISAAALDIRKDGRMTFPLWEGKRNNRLTIAPANLDASSREILNRIITNQYDHGTLQFMYDDRKRKWMAALSYTAVVQEREPSATDEGLVAGLDLNIITTAQACYVSDKTGKVKPFADRVVIPQTTLRAWNRVHAEKVSRLKSNDADYGLRQGHGRDRKLRVTEAVADKQANLTKTAVLQVACAIVNKIAKRGAHTLVLENLKGITEDMFNQTEGLKGRARGRVRRQYLQFQQYALRQAIIGVAQKSGIRIVEADAHYTSKQCSKCGTVWTFTTPESAPTPTHKRELLGKMIKPPVKEAGSDKGYGYMGAFKKFRCSCGYEAHGDVNAAINIARKGIGAQPAQAQEESRVA